MRRAMRAAAGFLMLALIVAAASVAPRIARGGMQTATPDLPFAHAMNGNFPSWGGPSSTHSGYDFFGLTSLEPIYASHSGIATQDTNNTATCTSSTSPGKSVKIQHGGSVYTRYHHLSSFALPNSPTWVAAGDLVGYQGITGSSGCSYHLHQEFRPVGVSGVWLKYNDIAADPSISAGSPIAFDGGWAFTTTGDTSAEYFAAYGEPGDIPIMGDWNNNNRDTPGIVRLLPNGNLEWHLSNTLIGSGQPIQTSYTPFLWGLKGDKVIVGDWDGDGDDTPGIVRVDNPSVPGSLTTFWLTNNTTAGAVHHTVSWGSYPGRTPIVGDWNDNGRDTPGIFWNEGQSWWLTNTILPSGNQLGWTPFAWGLQYDVPMSGHWANTGADVPIVLQKNPNTFGQNLQWFRSNGIPASGLNNFTFGPMSSYPIVADWDSDTLDEFVYVD